MLTLLTQKVTHSRPPALSVIAPEEVPCCRRIYDKSGGAVGACLRNHRPCVVLSKYTADALAHRDKLMELSTRVRHADRRRCWHVSAGSPAHSSLSASVGCHLNGRAMALGRANDLAACYAAMASIGCEAAAVPQTCCVLFLGLE
jgi:hypothetical protein